MRRAIPETQSDAASEGQEAHELASSLLTGVAVDTSLYPQEMIDAVGIYTHEVNKASLCGGSMWGAEQMLQNDTIHPENFGTVDSWHYDADIKTLTVWDFKYGHMEVEAFENYQCLNYAALILAGPLASHHVEQINIRIIQPRAFRGDPVDSWCLTRGEAEQYFNQLRRAAALAMSPDAPLCSGGHCRYCEVKLQCHALQEVALWASEYTHSASPMGLSVDELGRELTILSVAEKALNFRKMGVEAQVEQLLKDGKIVPGWALESSSGRLEWVADSKMIIEYGKLFGLNLAKETQSITPAQAIKLGLPTEVAHMFATRKAGSIKLTKSDLNASMKRAFGSGQ
jgi:hypothetical protein